MSIEGFVANSEARLEELRNRVRDIIKKDGGKKIFRHIQKEMKEIDQLNTAIYKATRRGVRE